MNGLSEGRRGARIPAPGTFCPRLLRSPYESSECQLFALVAFGRFALNASERFGRT
jgi:hypothetical protein